MGSESLGAEPDANLGGGVGARNRESVADGLVGVRPPVLPQRQLCEVHVVNPEPAILAQRAACRIEVRARLVESAATDLDFSPVHEQHVWIVGGEGAQRGGADAVGPLPFANCDKGLDVVGHEDGVVHAVAADDFEPDLSQSSRLIAVAQALSARP